jgi:hypothetical protein
VNLKTRKFEVFEQGAGLHSLIVFYNRKTARKVNAYLGFPYPEDTAFSADDEVLFRNIGDNKLVGALRLAGHKNLA